MLRVILALIALALLSSPAQAETCGDVPRIEGPPVYVVLYGYPEAPGTSLQRLAMVDLDLAHMTRFFSALAPRQMYVHGERAEQLDPSWRGLVGSVDAIVDDIDANPSPQRPEVYLYLAGHGMTSGGMSGEGGGRLVIFGRPEPDATEPGHDGRIHSALIADRLLAPLAERARVHLIADTCHSHHLLETREMKRRQRVWKAPPEPTFPSIFSATFPGVGAHLATRTVTHESPRHGGLFSHAIRSMAIGFGDFDRDGVLTYGEMQRALGWLAGSMGKLPQPIVVAPGLDGDTPFIDWRASPAAARVCLPRAVSGRRVLSAGGRAYATVRTPGPEGPLWLPKGDAFGIGTGEWGGPWHRFVADDGMARLRRAWGAE